MPKPAKLFWISRHMKNSLSNSTTNLSSCRTTNHTQRGNNENYVCERSVQILSEHFANLKTNSSAVVWRKLYLIFKLTGFTFVNTIGYISAALQFNLKEANCIQLVLYSSERPFGQYLWFGPTEIREYKLPLDPHVYTRNAVSLQAIRPTHIFRCKFHLHWKMLGNYVEMENDFLTNTTWTLLHL